MSPLLAQDDSGYADPLAIIFGILVVVCLGLCAALKSSSSIAKGLGKEAERQSKKVYELEKELRQKSQQTGETNTIICSGCSQILRYTPRLEPFTIRCPRCKTQMEIGMPVKPPVLPTGIPDDSTESLNPEVPHVILYFAIEAASEAIKTAELAASIRFNKAIHYALYKEIVSYYSKIAISAIMIKRGWDGKDKYVQVETEVFSALRRNLTRRQYQFEDFVDKKSRRITEAYFVRSIDGLEIKEEQVYAFAEKCHQQDILSKMPDDQLDVFYYTMRIARLLSVHDPIDGVIGNGVSKILVNQLMAFTDKIQTVVNEL
jgi:hypothetical protein